MHNDEVAVVINTTSKYKEIWPMLFGQLEKYSNWNNIYVFTDESAPILEKYKVVLYDPHVDFCTQYLSCLKKVPEQYCITMNDDYILYDQVNNTEITRLKEIISGDEKISLIRLLKGLNGTSKQYSDKLYYLELNEEFFYTQGISLWKTRTLEKIHELCPPSGIGRANNEPQLEVVANLACKKMKLNGLYYYDNEPKRGMYHYDSSIVPHIASALVSGKWNISEYENELTVLIKKYNINPMVRGLC